MAISSFPFKDGFNKTRGKDKGKNLKRLRSVKVPNLDRLRMSMSRAKPEFRSPSESSSRSSSSSISMSKTSPNYMKATSSFYARKEALQSNPGDKSSPSTPKSKFIKDTVKKSDTKVGNSGKSLKKMSSLKSLRRLSSIKLRQFSRKYGTRNLSSHRVPVSMDDTISEETSSSVYIDDDQDQEYSTRKAWVKPKIKLEKSRSIKLTKLTSMRSSRRRMKSRFDGDGENVLISNDEMSHIHPHYMKGTSSQEARKNSSKTLVSGTALKPLRFLRRIPSLRVRSRVRKGSSDAAKVPGASIDRPTCSSTLKSSKFPDIIEHHSVECEFKGASTANLCTYHYCSLNGHHHAPSQPLKSFLSAKRHSLRNQKSKHLQDHAGSKVAKGRKETVAGETCNDYFIEIYAKDGDNSNMLIEKQKMADEETTNSGLSHAGESNSIILDKSKYNSMWHLIYQHIVSKDAPKTSEKEIDSDADTPKDTDSSRSHYETHQDEVGDSQRAGCEKLEFDQSDVVRLVRDAVTEILSVHETSSHQQDVPDENIAKGDAEDSSLEIEDKHCLIENVGIQEQDKVSSDERNEPQRSAVSGYSKLKRLMLSAKFIKAMERLRKINPQRPRYLSPETMSEAERVNLRRINMEDRRNKEEWMLDYALRQVIAKLAPDQQRKVTLLVQAFEKFNPDDIERVRNKDNELVSNEDYPAQEVIKTRTDMAPGTKVTTDTALGIGDAGGDCPDKLSETPEERNMTHEESSLLLNVPSQFPPENSELSATGEATTILFDKNKYNSMWGLIYEHVLSSKAGLPGDERTYGAVEKEQDEEASVPIKMNAVHRSKGHYNTNHVEDRDDQSAGREKLEYDQSAAVRLVREALTEILRLHDPASNQQYGSDINIENTTCSSEQKFKGDKTLGEHRCLETEDTQFGPENARVPEQKSLPKEGNGPVKSISRNYGKLKKLIISTKFIKTMERMRKINPRRPKHLPPEMASEAEKVYLRHLSMKGTRNTEEWMLDYALRQVIGELAPDQQRRVALLVGAFEQVTPKKKEMAAKHCPMNNGEDRSIAYNNISREADDRISPSYEDEPTEEIQKKASKVGISRVNAALSDKNLESNCTNEISQENHEDGISSFKTEECNKHFELDCTNFHLQQQASSESNIDEKVSSFCEDALARGDQKEDCEVKDSGFEMELSEKSVELGYTNLHIHRQASTEGCPVCDQQILLRQCKEETDSNDTTKIRQYSTSAEGLGNDSQTNVAKGIFLDRQKYTRMWQLIYRRVKSVTIEEAGNQVPESVAEGKEISKENRSSESVTDAELVSQNASHQNVEFLQHDAIEFVQEAIDHILLHQGHKNDPDAITTTDVNSNQKLSDEYQGANYTAEDNPRTTVGGNQVNELPQGYSKLKRLILCNRFLKAMDKMRKSYPQKRRPLLMDSDAGIERAHLKHYNADEQKGAEEWMLDNALQQVITRLAPAQQRRVAVLVEAFEEMGPRMNGTKTEATCSSLARNKDMEEDEVLGSHQISNANFNMEAEGKEMSCRTEVPAGMILQGIHEGPASRLAEEYTFIENCISVSSDRVPAEISDTVETPSTDANDEPASLTDKVSSGSCISLDETATKEKEIEMHYNPGTEFSEGSSKPENMEDECGSETAKDISSDTRKYTKLWSLIYHHVKSGNIDNEETPNCEKASLERNMSDSFSESSSIEYQEMDAIKLAQEAIDEILLIQDPECDDQLIASGPTSDPAACNRKHSEGGEQNIPATTRNIASSSSDTGAAPEDEKTTSGMGNINLQVSPKSYNKLSKVILCRRFIKAMEKIRKLKQRGPNYLPQQTSPTAESVNLRHQEVNDKSWEEWMLDQALQQVVGRLRPTQKKRVSLLVEAFEAVSSEPETKSRQRGNAMVPQKGAR